MSKVDANLDGVSKEVLEKLQGLFLGIGDNASIGDLYEILQFALTRTKIDSKGEKEKDLTPIEEDFYKVFSYIRKHLLDSGVEESGFQKLIESSQAFMRLSYMSEVLAYSVKKDPKSSSDNLTEENLLNLTYEYEDNIDINLICNEIITGLDKMRANIDATFLEYIKNEKLLKMDEDIVDKNLPVNDRLELCKRRLEIVDNISNSLFGNSSKDRFELQYKISRLSTIVPRLVNEESAKLYDSFYEKSEELFILSFSQTIAAKKRINFDKVIPTHQIADGGDLDKKYKNLDEFALLSESAAIMESTYDITNKLLKELQDLQVLIFGEGIKNQWEKDRLYSQLSNSVEDWKVNLEASNTKEIGDMTEYLDTNELDAETLFQFIKTIHSAPPKDMVTGLLIARIFSINYIGKKNENNWKDIYAGISKYLTAHAPIYQIENSAKKIDEFTKNNLSVDAESLLELAHNTNIELVEMVNEIELAYHKRGESRLDLENFLKTYSSESEDSRKEKIEVIFNQVKGLQLFNIAKEYEIVSKLSFIDNCKKAKYKTEISNINKNNKELFLDLIKFKNIYNKAIAFDDNLHSRIKFNQLSHEDVLLYGQFSAETDIDYNEAKISITSHINHPKDINTGNISNGNSEKSLLDNKFISFPIIILGFFIGKYLGLIGLLGTFGSMYLGYLLGQWILKNKNEDKFIAKILIWSNLFTWIVPFIGFFTSVASFEINKDKGSKKLFYMSILSFIATVINSIIGIMGSL